VFDILSLKSNGGTDENRARGLQYAVKLNDYFIQKVINDEEVILFDPKDAPDLIAKVGDEFNSTYENYLLRNNIRRKKVKARELWEKIFKERSETGNIYLFHEENVNNTSMLNRYVGSSNLCLAGDTKVKMADGKEKNLQDVKIGDIVKSVNHVNGNIEDKTVTNSALMSKKAKVMKITDDSSGKSIICTPEHQVWTENRGYVMAKDLITEDILKII
jgi:ribonucleotide reductase alpha subunit